MASTQWRRYRKLHANISEKLQDASPKGELKFNVMERLGLAWRGESCGYFEKHTVSVVLVFFLGECSMGLTSGALRHKAPSAL